MASVFYPSEAFIYNRVTSGSEFSELLFASPPNSIFVFTNSGSAFASSSLVASASYVTTSSYAISASWAPPIPSDSASYATTASYALNGGGGPSVSSSYSETSSYAISASWAPPIPSDSASYATTASYSEFSSASFDYFNSNASNGYFPQWVNGKLSSTSSIKVSQSIYHYINGNAYPIVEVPAALTVTQIDTSANNLLRGTGNKNDYIQLAIRNISSGPLASTDFIAEPNDATETTHYIDMGIGSDVYNDPRWPIVKAHDGYLYVEGGDLLIGTSKDPYIIRFFAGGSSPDSSSVYITKTGIYASGSLEGTSSWAKTSIISGYALIGLSSSFASQSIIALSAVSASWASSSISASYAPSIYQTSGSWASQSLSASYIKSSNIEGTASIARSASFASSSISSSYIVPGATFYLVSGSNGISPAFIEPYDYCPTTSLYRPPFKEGRLMWDHKYIDYSHYMDTNWRIHLGKEITIGVHNPYSVTLPRLSAVYIGTSSLEGAYQPDVYFAIADGTGLHSGVTGIIRNDIPSGSTGFMLMEGVMHRTDMGTLSVGDQLWLSTTTPGGYTLTKPGQPYEQVSLGYCSEAGPLGSFICDRFVYPPPPNAYAGVTSTVIIDTSLNDGTIIVSTGSVNLFDDSTGVGLVTSYPLSQTTFNVITGSTNYIIAEHSASSTTVAKYSLTTDANYANGINIVRVAILDINYKGPNNWDVHQFPIGIVGLALANRINNKDIRLYGYQRESGLTLYTTGSNRNFGITEGNVWYGPNSHVVPTFDTTLSGYYTYLFSTTSSNGTSSWSQTSSSVFQNNYYDNGNGLSLLTPSYYTVNFVYRLMGTTDEAAIVLSSAQFTTSLEASNNATTPPNLPSTIKDLGILVGRFICQSGSNTPTIDSAFSNTFIPAVVTNHESLLGLQGGIGGQHYHSTLAEYTGTGTGVFIRNNRPVFAEATPYHIPFWDIQGRLTLTGSVQVQQGQYVTINSASTDIINPEALLVKQANTTSVNLIGGYGNINNYLQVNVQNLNSGLTASSDFIATADNGDLNNNYVDLGINSSTYALADFSIGGPNDSYLLSNGGNLAIGTATPGKIVILHSGGTTADKERARITDAGLLATGSLLGTASYATTASYYNQKWLNTGSSYPITSSWATSASYAPSIYQTSGSWASQSLSASYAINAGTAYAINFIPLSATSASWASQSLSASYSPLILPQNISINSISASNGILIGPSTDSSASLYISGSPLNKIIEIDRYDGQEVFVLDQNGTSNISYGLITGSLFGTSSYAISASWAPTGGGVVDGGSYKISASFASSSISASYAISAFSASYAPGTPSLSASVADTASYLINNQKFATQTLSIAYAIALG